MHWVLAAKRSQIVGTLLSFPTSHFTPCSGRFLRRQIPDITDNPHVSRDVAAIRCSHNVDMSTAERHVLGEEEGRGRREAMLEVGYFAFASHRSTSTYLDENLNNDNNNNRAASTALTTDAPHVIITAFCCHVA